MDRAKKLTLDMNKLKNVPSKNENNDRKLAIFGQKNGIEVPESFVDNSKTLEI
jgi:hypothetical protein